MRAISPMPYSLIPRAAGAAHPEPHTPLDDTLN